MFPSPLSASICCAGSGCIRSTVWYSVLDILWLTHIQGRILCHGAQARAWQTTPSGLDLARCVLVAAAAARAD